MKIPRWLRLLLFGAGGDVSIPTWVKSVPDPADYEARFEAKRRMLRSGHGLRRGAQTLAVGPEPKQKLTVAVSELYPGKGAKDRGWR